MWVMKAIKYAETHFKVRKLLAIEFREVLLKTGFEEGKKKVNIK